MKLCYVCKIEKALDNFQKRVKNSDGLNNKCKQCSSDYDKNIYKNSDKRKLGIKKCKADSVVRAKILIEDYKSLHPCVDCSISDIEVLSFDHIRGQKKFNVSDGVQRGLGEDTLLLEIKKCEVVCMNCHQKRTKKRNRDAQVAQW